MSKYIDAEKLKSIIKVQIKERKEWMKDIDRSDRQDQLWSDLNGEDMSILNTINSLQQEQPDVDLEREIDEHSEQMPMSEFTHESEEDRYIEWAKGEFRHFYELGLNARKEE